MLNKAGHVWIQADRTQRTETIQTLFLSSCLTEVILPVHIPFSAYGKNMVTCDSMKVSALAIDKRDDEIFGADTAFTLEDPPVSVMVCGNIVSAGECGG